PVDPLVAGADHSHENHSSHNHSGEFLASINLSYANLNGTNLTNANLNNANLSSAGSIRGGTQPEGFSMNLHKLTPSAFATLGVRVAALLFENRADCCATNAVNS
ncbi:MAG: pentapeptide repeat-containing protein, partial [Pirellulales bacterium]